MLNERRDIYQPEQSRSPSILSNFTEDLSAESNRNRGASQARLNNEKNVYIKRLDCFLNSVSIDQIEDKQNEDECIQAYWRLFQANGQINSIVTNGISYDDFRNGFFFAAYDLSTSGKSGTGFVVPSIRVGHLRMRLLLSDAIPMDLTMVLFCEFPTTLFLSKDAGIPTKSRVTKSFTPR
jgi:hypothetical protein